MTQDTSEINQALTVVGSSFLRLLAATEQYSASTQGHTKELNATVAVVNRAAAIDRVCQKMASTVSSFTSKIEIELPPLDASCATLERNKNTIATLIDSQPVEARALRGTMRELLEATTQTVTSTKTLRASAVGMQSASPILAAPSRRLVQALDRLIKVAESQVTFHKQQIAIINQKLRD